MFEILVLRSNFYSSFTTLDSWTFNEMGKSACILRWTSFPRSFKSLSTSKLEKQSQILVRILKTIYLTSLNFVKMLIQTR